MSAVVIVDTVRAIGAPSLVATRSVSLAPGGLSGRPARFPGFPSTAERLAGYGLRLEHVRDRLLDRRGRAGSGSGGARLRVALLSGAHPHPDQPTEPLAG